MSEMTAQANSQNSSTDNQQTGASTEFLYDALSPQRVPFTKTHGGFRYPIYITFAPLGDENGEQALAAYEAARNVRMAQSGSEVDASSDLFNASQVLWDLLHVKTEGWGPEDGSKFKLRDRHGAIQNGLLACAIKELPLADAQTASDKKPWDDDEEESTETYYLRAQFNGREILTTHVLKQPTERRPSPGVESQQERYAKLMSQSKIVQGDRLGTQESKVPARMNALCKLYDEMKENISGYKGGIVPKHHKVELIHAHMGGELETTEAK